MIVALPWPRHALSQNARASRGAVIKATKLDRRDAFYLCKEAGFVKLSADRATVRVTFSKPNPRIDDQNAIGWCKAQMDGVADAIGVDDNHWDVTWAFSGATKPGAVLVEIGQP